jgi:hypothetical protein
VRPRRSRSPFHRQLYSVGVAYVWRGGKGWRAARSPVAWLRAERISERNWHARELRRCTRRGHRAGCPPNAECGVRNAEWGNLRSRTAGVLARSGSDGASAPVHSESGWVAGAAADGDVRSPFGSGLGFGVYSVFNPWRLISGIPVGRVPPHGARTPLARRTGERGKTPRRGTRPTTRRAQII